MSVYGGQILTSSTYVKPTIVPRNIAPNVGASGAGTTRGSPEDVTSMVDGPASVGGLY